MGRDLFANTNAYLLAMTLLVSFLHMIFEFLAFKNDVQFWNACDPSMLGKYISVQSILIGIFMQIILLAYLWDESANVLVLITSIGQILVDAWKVQRAMEMRVVWIFGKIPFIWWFSRVVKDKADDYDTVAMKYLAVLM